MKKKPAFKPENDCSYTVRIEFHDEYATDVAIARTFNNWRPAAAPMISLEQGRWIKELRLKEGVTNIDWWWTGSGCVIQPPPKKLQIRSMDLTRY